MTTQEETRTRNVLMVVWAQPGSGSRRALEVSERMGWRLHYSYPKRPYSLLHRYWWCFRDCLKKTRVVSPRLLVIQIGPGPACMVGIWANIVRGIPIIYDSHSSVYMSRKNTVFNWLYRIAFRRSRAVLIHNDEHIAQVQQLGGNPIVMRDPIPKFPDITDAPAVSLQSPAVFCTLSWRPDEPVEAILRAAEVLSDYHFYLSGKPKKDYRLPPNVTLTGFLPAEAYLAYLKSCDVIMALTSQESTVCCAGHEAVAVRQPLVTSDTAVLRQRFDGYAVFAEHSAKTLAKKIRQAYEQRAELKEAAGELDKRFEAEWREKSGLIEAAVRG